MNLRALSGMGMRLVLGSLVCGAAVCGAAIAQNTGQKAAKKPAKSSKPNILLVIMDDVGIDQMRSFGYGGGLPETTPTPNNIGAKMPNIDAVAYGGVRFRNTWSMPECSPGRAVMFTGRYPLRSHILQAIGPADLNNSQVATWETTTPKLLKEAHYTSALFGKFHLGGPENNEFGDGAPRSLGWDYFYGWTSGLPGAIDTTAGGAGAKGAYACGFVPRAGDQGGAENGACYIPSRTSMSCKELSGANDEGDSVGLQCLTQGGVLDPDASCQTHPPAHLNFNRENAHYVSPLVVNTGHTVEEPHLRDSRGRGFRATIEVDAAIRWIKEQKSSGHPWMATVSFSADHTPLQPPPGKLLTPETRESVRQVVDAGGGCTTPGAGNANVQLLSNAMIEGMDTEFGRLLVETGMAHFNDDGRTITYDPQDSNTVIVIVGDNGSLGSTVKAPFDGLRAKATAYQTGAWVPLIVAGPVVAQPNRDVNSMVNVADMFELFGEIAGIDVKQAVPRRIDSHPMMAYLTDPGQTSLRAYNFTQGGFNIQKNGTHNPPCVVPFPAGSQLPPQFPKESRGICSQVPVSKSVCEDNYGVWWGPGADSENTLPGFTGVADCWQVNQAIYKNDPGQYANRAVIQLPHTYSAVRNDDYKLVKNEADDYDPSTDGAKLVQSLEFYEVNEDPPATLKLDRLIAPPGTCCANLTPNGNTSGLTPEQLTVYNTLNQKLKSILGSSPPCPGDGNGDRVVNQVDLNDYHEIAKQWGKSSHYDFNFDALTNLNDKGTIEDHMGPCPAPLAH